MSPSVVAGFLAGLVAGLSFHLYALHGRGPWSYRVSVKHLRVEVRVLAERGMIKGPKELAELLTKHFATVAEHTDARALFPEPDDDDDETLH